MTDPTYDDEQPPPSWSDDGPLAVAYAPNRLESLLTAVVGLSLGGIAVGLDRSGVVLVGLAGLLLVGLAVTDTVIRPRLSADLEGITVRTLTRRLSAPWPAVALLVRPGRRLARLTATLELELGDRLVVLGRRELGADPADVADTLHRLAER